MRCDAQRHGYPTYAHLHCQKQAADLLPIQGGAGVGEPCSLYIDGKQPKAEQRELERGEGSKISRICWVDSDRPVKQCTKCRIHAGIPASCQRHGRWTSLPDPTHMASGMHLWFQAWIWPHTTAHRALNPYDNCITSDQNFL